RVLDLYLERLAEELADPRTRVRRHAGVAALLEALSARSDRVVGLLTGNIEVGAAAKLRAAGIGWETFRLSAFGSGHEDPAELPLIARQRALEQLGLDLPGAALVVIGDTPADIACGRSCGARAIAVATGRYSVDELARHEPASAFADLSDTDGVLAAIDQA